MMSDNIDTVFYFYEVLVGQTSASIWDIFREINDDIKSKINNDGKEYDIVINKKDIEKRFIQGKIRQFREDSPTIGKPENADERSVQMDADESVIESTYFTIKNMTLVMQSNTNTGGLRTAGKLAKQINLILKEKYETFQKDNKIRVNFKPITENFDELLKLAPKVFKSMEYKPFSKNTKIKDINLSGFTNGNEKELLNNVNDIENISIKIAKNKIFSKIKDISEDMNILDFFSSVRISWKDGGKTKNRNLKDYLVKNETKIKLAEKTKTIDSEDCFFKMSEIIKMDLYAAYFEGE